MLSPPSTIPAPCYGSQLHAKESQLRLYRRMANLCPRPVATSVQVLWAHSCVVREQPRENELGVIPRLAQQRFPGSDLQSMRRHFFLVPRPDLQSDVVGRDTVEEQTAEATSPVEVIPVKVRVENSTSASPHVVRSAAHCVGWIGWFGVPWWRREHLPRKHSASKYNTETYRYQSNRHPVTGPWRKQLTQSQPGCSNSPGGCTEQQQVR